VPSRRPVEAEDRLFGDRESNRFPGPALDINDADAANLDFGSLQALISQQMASIEAEWEPDVGGRPPSTDFLRAEAETRFPATAYSARAVEEAAFSSGAAMSGFSSAFPAAEPPLHDSREFPGTSLSARAARRGRDFRSPDQEEDFRVPDADLRAAPRPQMPAAPSFRDERSVGERAGKRERDEDGRRIERRSAYNPRHTYSGRSGGEPVAATLNLQYAVPPDAFPEEEKPASRRTPRGSAGVGGDRFAYRRSRRAEDATTLDG
jgi:hypothetical protein